MHNIIPIPVRIRKKCWEFAMECSYTNKTQYAMRNQFNLSWIQSQIMIGKMGEWAAQQFLGRGCSRPDFKIYQGRQKSYDADLRFNGLNVHVKSQSQDSAAMYGVSWLFQKNDPLYKGKADDDLIIGIVVYDDEKEPFAEVVMYGKVEDLVFGKPKKKSMQDTKVAIYLEDNKKLLYKG